MDSDGFVWFAVSYGDAILDVLVVAAVTGFAVGVAAHWLHICTCVPGTVAVAGPGHPTGGWPSHWELPDLAVDALEWQVRFKRLAVFRRPANFCIHDGQLRGEVLCKDLTVTLSCGAGGITYVSIHGATFVSVFRYCPAVKAMVYRGAEVRVMSLDEVMGMVENCLVWTEPGGRCG
ncbi:hypothetical protein DICA1_A07844 [Diutina catenulata]